MKSASLDLFIFADALGWVNLHDQLPQNSCGLIQRNGQRKPDFYAFMNN